MGVRLTSAACLWFCLTAAAFATESKEFEPVDLPPQLAKRLDGIPDEKIEFLRGEDALMFAERHGERAVRDRGHPGRPDREPRFGDLHDRADHRHELSAWPACCRVRR